MKLLLASLLLMLASLVQAAETRFDSVYFFQSEKTLIDKQVNFEEVARFSRKMQSNVWNVLKKASMLNSSGFLPLPPGWIWSLCCMNTTRIR
jgi:hypothetical protein